MIRIFPVLADVAGVALEAGPGFVGFVAMSAMRERLGSEEVEAGCPFGKALRA